MSKATIVVLSDPNGGEEALGRVYNALAVAFDFKRQQLPVKIVFQGTGTRWASVLAKPDHPVHELFKAVEDTIAGASAGCAVVFGAEESARQEGLQFITDNPVPGTKGLPSIVAYLSEGPVLIF